MDPVFAALTFGSEKIVLEQKREPIPILSG